MELKNLFSFESKIGNKLKITYNDSEKITIIITLILTGGEPLDSIYFTFFCKTHWFVPNFDYRGCSHVQITNADTKEHIVKWTLPPNITKGINTQNVICIGLNKTGTTSLTKDLQNLGYRFLPEPYGILKLSSDVYHDDYHSLYSLLDNPRFNAYEDMPFSLPTVYEKMYNYRPNDIFILTVRENSEKWVKSVIKYYKWVFENQNLTTFGNSYAFYTPFGKTENTNFIKPMLDFWGIKSLDNLEKNLKDVYNKHNYDVINFFKKNNSQNFIVIDVSKKGELKRLTDWLYVKNDKQDFTWENKSK